MHNQLQRQWYLTAAAVLVFASASFAQATTSMSLTGVGNGATVGDVYVDPYTGTVGGVAGTSVICDDWSNNSYVGESWTANVINAAAVASSGTPMFGDNQALYNELAWLGSKLLASPTNPTLQAEISFAMWALTYGANGTSTDSTSPLTYLSEYGTSAELAAAQNYLCEAAGATITGCTGTGEGNYNAAGWEILTPAGQGTCNGSPCGTPQEFLVYTPESPTAILLGADLLGLATLIFLFRRRMARAES